MNESSAASRFQEVIEAVEGLEPDDQLMLIQIIRQRLLQHRRTELAAQIAEARAAYERGGVRRGSAADLLDELDE